MHRYTLPVLALALLACPPTIRKVGLQMVEQGHYPQAVDYWLQAYDAEEEENPRALADALLYVEDACTRLMDVAREHEAEGRYTESRETYLELQRFSERVASHGAPACEGTDAAAELADVEEALAAERYAAAQLWIEEGQWDKALNDLELCRALRPGYLDSALLMAEAYRGWGTQDVAEARYHAAIDHFDLAWQKGGAEADHLWSGAIHAALGRDYLAKGACRNAVLELRQATFLESDLTLTEDLARAHHCARIDLVVLPIEDLTAEEGSTMAFGALLRDELEAGLRDSATEFVRLLDPDSQQVKRLSDPAFLVAKEGRTYQIRGRITQAVSEDPEPITVERTAMATRAMACDKQGTFDTAGEEWCEKAERIRYMETTAARTSRLSGSVRVVAAHSGEQVLTAPIQVELSRESLSTDGFTLVGKPIEVAAAAERGVLGVDEALLALLRAPEPLPSEARLRSQAVHELADRATRAILAEIDVPMVVPEAKRLKIKPPVTEAEDLQFRPTEMEVEQEEPPPEPEPEPQPTEVRIIRVTPEE